jgi:hypothetical protein
MAGKEPRCDVGKVEESLLEMRREMNRFEGASHVE